MPTENVQDYPRPPVIEAVAQRVRVFLGGTIVAETWTALRVLETHHAPTYYIPRYDVLTGALVPVSGHTRCIWKGIAQYFDLSVNRISSAKAAWSYPDPNEGFEALREHVAFYPQRVELCQIGTTTAHGQPGSPYGGWVTPNLRGLVNPTT